MCFFWFRLYGSPFRGSKPPKALILVASFYRAFNAVYGRIGRSGSEDIILQLIRFKCMPCLLYALEACPVNKTQLRSLQFTLNRVLMKVFRTTSMDVIAECRYWFGLLEMETLIAKRKRVLWPNTFSLTTYYVNCSLMLRVCNV